MIENNSRQSHGRIFWFLVGFLCGGAVFISLICLAVFGIPQVKAHLGWGVPLMNVLLWPIILFGDHFGAIGIICGKVLTFLWFPVISGIVFVWCVSRVRNR